VVPEKAGSSREQRGKNKMGNLCTARGEEIQQCMSTYGIRRRLKGFLSNIFSFL
jgi:hypothetical protein